jgi:hypothetical protein
MVSVRREKMKGENKKQIKQEKRNKKQKVNKMR